MYKFIAKFKYADEKELEPYCVFYANYCGFKPEKIEKLFLKEDGYIIDYNNNSIIYENEDGIFEQVLKFVLEDFMYVISVSYYDLYINELKLN
jgi:hypothetical protein